MKVITKRTGKILALFLLIGAVILASFPARVSRALTAGDTVTTYPFKTGVNAYKYGALWNSPTAGASESVWMTLTAGFDTATVDLSSAEYMAVQFKSVAGAPGLTFALEQGATRFSMGASTMDGKPVYFIKENGEVVKLSDILYGAINITHTGTLLVPMTSIANQWGDITDKSGLNAVDKILFTTNNQFNWNYSLIVGEVGFYDGDPTVTDTVFTKILSLDSETKYGKFALSEKSGSISMVERAVDPVMGDTKIAVEFTGKTAWNIWDGGALGTAESVKDSYGDDAVKITCTGANPTGDAYMATTMFDGAGHDFSGGNGMTFWARNDSDTEVSFGLEADCRIPNPNYNPEQPAGKPKFISDRFNVKQGNRYYLYDINSGLTYIYMSKPNINLPVGFEGFIRVPFETFTRAEWSQNGVTSFDTEIGVIPYIAITVFSGTFIDKPFSVNKFGSYTGSPQFITSHNTGSTIGDLMGL